MLAIVPECFKYFDKRRPVLFGQAPGAFQKLVKGPRWHPGSRFNCGNGKELHTGVRKKLKDGVCDFVDQVPPRSLVREKTAVFGVASTALPDIRGWVPVPSVGNVDNFPRPVAVILPDFKL